MTDLNLYSLEHNAGRGWEVSAAPKDGSGTLYFSNEDATKLLGNYSAYDNIRSLEKWYGKIAPYDKYDSPIVIDLSDSIDDDSLHLFVLAEYIRDRLELQKRGGKIKTVYPEDCMNVYHPDEFLSQRYVSVSKAQRYLKACGMGMIRIDTESYRYPLDPHSMPVCTALTMRRLLSSVKDRPTAVSTSLFIKAVRNNHERLFYGDSRVNVTELVSLGIVPASALDNIPSFEETEESVMHESRHGGRRDRTTVGVFVDVETVIDMAGGREALFSRVSSIPEDGLNHRVEQASEISRLLTDRSLSRLTIINYGEALNRNRINRSNQSGVE